MYQILQKEEVRKLVINNNMNAVNSWRNSFNNTQSVQKSISKLASGLRINSAADDAAGLAISEKMRAQIKGLDQASRNIQEGISLIQTAEGGLNEIHSLVQRGRELSVQASNGTLTDNDRRSIQGEINQINVEVDRISNTTEFNTKKLLNQAATSSSADAVIKGLKSGWLEVAEKMIVSNYGLSGAGNNLKVYLDQGSPYGTLAYVGGTTANIELHIDMSDFEPGSFPNGINGLGKGFYDDRIIAHEMVHASMNADFGATKINSIHSGNGVWFLEGAAEFIHGADERLKSIIGTAGTIDATKVSGLASRATDLLNGAVWNGDDKDYSAAYVIFKYLEDNLSVGSNYVDIMDDIAASADTGINAVKTALGIHSDSGSFGQFVTDFSQVGAGGAVDYITNHITLNWGADETDTGSIAGSDHGGGALNAENVVDESTAADTADGQPLTNFNVIWPSVSTVEPICIQLGSNSGDTLRISLVDVSSSSIGTKDADVVNKPSEAIDKFDNAINIISFNRSSFGALQNRLEKAYIIANNTAENLTASESRIRDVDMAKEMMSYSKNNILLQAAQAMLAQSNQQPQSILQLLK